MAKGKFERTKPHVNVGRSGTWIMADDADGGADAGVESAVGGRRRPRPDRQCAGGEGAGDHDQYGARGIRERRTGTTSTWTVRGTRTT